MIWGGDLALVDSHYKPDAAPHHAQLSFSHMDQTESERMSSEQQASQMISAVYGVLKQYLALILQAVDRQDCALRD